MVKYTDIHKAIVDKLKSKFAGVEITSNDVSEGFSRPSFFISFDNMKSNDFMGEALDRELTVRIYYFSKDRYKNKIELLNVQDELNELFLKDNIIQVDSDTKIEIEELEFDVVDKVLHCYFDIRLSEDYDRIDSLPNMEELHVDNKIFLD
jgi:hypothetical protein